MPLEWLIPFNVLLTLGFFSAFFFLVQFYGPVEIKIFFKVLLWFLDRLSIFPRRIVYFSSFFFLLWIYLIHRNKARLTGYRVQLRVERQKQLFRPWEKNCTIESDNLFRKIGAGWFLEILDKMSRVKQSFVVPVSVILQGLIGAMLFRRYYFSHSWSQISVKI